MKPRSFDDEGCNLDPRKCDCGKGEYCPLWADEWRAYYAGRTDAAVAFVEESGGFENAVRRLLS